MIFRNRKKTTPGVCHDCIVVIEDNEDVIHLLEHVLGKEGYGLKLARDGHEAMEIIDTQPPPSLVLLDLMIPIHSGFEILRHLRELHDWKHVPVIVLSGRQHEKDISRARALGADNYLLKPFEPRILLQQVRSLVAVQGE